MRNSLTIEADVAGPTISRHIYGHFAEHLGRCVYGGIWVGKGSEIPNVDGYRKDVAEALKAIRIPNLRWPGGCFADEYHWRDGIGPKAARSRMVNTHWGGLVEDNSFGTHEFLDYCELLGCEPYVCGNVGSGTVQEMSEWVEYITFSGESPRAAERARNGREKPWRLPFFGVGNENWGCGGNMRAEYYADLYRRYQTYVRQYGPDKIMKIAGGPGGDDYYWTEVLMREAARHMDGLSLHHYTLAGDWTKKGSATVFDEGGWFASLKSALRMAEIIKRNRAIMDRYDPEGRVALVVDEWGCWHDPEPGTNPGFLYQQNTMRDALVAGITLNIFHDNAERVRVANLAQMVNVLQAPILTEGQRMVLTPTYHVLDLYKGHMDAERLRAHLVTEEYAHGGISIPALSASASKSKDGSIAVTLCNANPASSIELPVAVRGIDARGAKLEGRCLAAGAMNAMNSFEAPDAVRPRELRVEPIEGGFRVSLPPMSVSAIKVDGRAGRG
jgi:alpha-N-arabinofuranosidase